MRGNGDDVVGPDNCTNDGDGDEPRGTEASGRLGVGCKETGDGVDGQVFEAACISGGSNNMAGGTTVGRDGQGTEGINAGGCGS